MDILLYTTFAGFVFSIGISPWITLFAVSASSASVFELTASPGLNMSYPPSSL